MKSFIKISRLLVNYISLFILDRSDLVIGEQTHNVKMVPGTIPIYESVRYTCQFINRWTSERHPNLYPNSAHWSPMVIASHSDDYSMWSSGSQATKGVENVAEIGATGTLKNELKAAGDSVGSFAMASGGAFYPSDNNQKWSITDNLMMDENHPLISSISMIAPSPDWFTGLNDFSPVQNGTWLSSFTVNTYPWDAGTESGDTYSLSNLATDPREETFRLDVERIPSSTLVFLSPEGDNVKPVARWECSLMVDECNERKKNKFYHKPRKDEDGNIIGFKTKQCKWLQKRSMKMKNKICKRTRRSKEFGPAKEVCPVTCGICMIVT